MEHHSQIPIGPLKIPVLLIHEVILINENIIFIKSQNKPKEQDTIVQIQRFI